MTDPAEGIGPLDDDYDALQPKPGGRALTVAIFLLCALPEVMLSGADFGYWATPRLRMTAIELAGFWPGLLGTWQPNYPAQPWLMFASYGFLHAGLMHFVVNMLTLFSLLPAVTERIGVPRAVLVYILGMIGGALGYALLSRMAAPMVGASGALFGLAGALLAWDYAERRARRLSLTPVRRSVLLLILLNLVLWWAMNGLLAWQAHLGGFVAGWLVALYLAPPMRAKIRS